MGAMMPRHSTNWCRGYESTCYVVGSICPDTGIFEVPVFLTKFLGDSLSPGAFGSECG